MYIQPYMQLQYPASLVRHAHEHPCHIYASMHQSKQTHSAKCSDCAIELWVSDDLFLRKQKRKKGPERQKQGTGFRLLRVWSLLFGFRAFLRDAREGRSCHP